MKVTVLSSGGVDSTTCLAEAVAEVGAENVIALSIYYGQKHDRELASAREIASYYGVRHIEADLIEIFRDSTSSLLAHADAEIPHASYGEQVGTHDGGPVSTYVPFRNGLFLSAAASIALGNGCERLVYGAHADDAAGSAYPDCSEAFVAAMGTAIREGSGGMLTLDAPYVRLHKKDIVAKGLALHAPYHLTWSCYEGGDAPCGACGTCIDRMRAFEANGARDPLSRY